MESHSDANGNMAALSATGLHEAHRPAPFFGPSQIVNGWQFKLVSFFPGTCIEYTARPKGNRLPRQVLKGFHATIFTSMNTSDQKNQFLVHPDING
jgi:hypothetical protein